jgi:hypothetical protein
MSISHFIHNGIVETEKLLVIVMTSPEQFGAKLLRWNLPHIPACVQGLIWSYTYTSRLCHFFSCATLPYSLEERPAGKARHNALYNLNVFLEKYNCMYITACFFVTFKSNPSSSSKNLFIKGIVTVFIIST